MATLTRAQRRYFYNTGTPANWYDPTKKKNEYSAASRTSIANALSDDTNKVKAIVTIAIGDEAGPSDEYVKVKFVRNGVPMALYKSKAFDQADAKAFRNEVYGELGLTAPL